MNRRRPNPQFAFAFENPIPPARGPESNGVYRAVVALRSIGFTVWRAGYRHHVINGIMAQTPQEKHRLKP